MSTKEDTKQVIETPLLSPNACWYVRPNENKSHKKNKTGPCRRWGHSSDIIDSRLFIYGGTGHTTNPRHWESVYKLELENWDWTKLEAINKSPGPRDSHSCIIQSTKLYVFGGSNGNDSKNDMFEYDLNANSWKKIDCKGVLPSPREGHSACLFDDKYMVIYGGWNGEETFDDCYLFDIPQKTWIKVDKKTGPEPTPRESQSCCMLRGYMYLFGGQGNNIVKQGENFDNFFNDLHRFRIIFEEGSVTAIWEKVEPEGIKPSKRSSHSACAYKDRYMFIMGGEGYPPDFNEDAPMDENSKPPVKVDDDEEEYPCYPKNDVWFYDIEVNQWFKLKIKNNEEFIPRFAHTCNIYKDYLVVFGGLRDYHHSTNDICVLSLDGSDPFAGGSNGQGKIKNGPPSPIQEEPEKEKPEKPERQKPVVATPAPTTKQTKAKPGHNSFNPLAPTHHGTHNEPVAKEPVETKSIIRYEGPLVSISFLHSLSRTLSWPLAAFGLLLDNALIVKAANFKVNYITRPKNKKKGKEMEEEPTAPKNEESVTYLVIEDDGQGWKSKEFTNILMSYDTDTPDIYADTTEVVAEEDKKDKINEFAFNLKVAGFRLGKTILYVSRAEDEVSIGFISADKRYNPNVHSSHVFFATWNRKTQEFISNNGQKNKSIILNALNGIINEEEILKSVEKIGNRIFVLDLNSVMVSGTAGKNEDFELVLKKKDSLSDIIIRTLDKNIRPFYTNYPIIELSLRTYLSFFFLDPSKQTIEISINDGKIDMIGLKEIVEVKADPTNTIQLKEEGLFDGVALRTMIKKEEEAKEVNVGIKTRGKKTAQEREDSEWNQGILVYYNNRLIRRLENPKLGNLDFLSSKITQINSQPDQPLPSLLFDLNGYVDLKPHFKPNIFKTEIENPYFSNFFYANVLGKLYGNDVNVKRKSESIEETDSATKKIKTNNS